MGNGSNGSSRVTLRSGFPDEHRIRLLENDIDVVERAIVKRFDELSSDLKRLFWAVGSLGATIIAGLAIALVSR